MKIYDLPLNSVACKEYENLAVRAHGLYYSYD